MLLTLAVWAVHPRQAVAVQPAARRRRANGGWVMSPWMDAGQPIVEDWFKVVVCVLLVTTVNTEKALKTVIVGFVAVMGVYMLHSFKEYLGGRHARGTEFAGRVAELYWHCEELPHR